MERRVLIAVILSFVILYAFQVMFPTPPDKQTQKPVQANKAATAPNASAPAASNPKASVQGAPEAPAPASASASSTAAAPPAAPTTPSRDIDVETPFVHAVFTTRGAAIKSWRLKKYRDTDGHPLEMVAGHAPAAEPLPLTLATDDSAVTATLASANYTVSSETPGDATHGWTAQFDYTDPSGLHAHKTIALNPSKPYLITVSASITRNGQPLPTTIEWGPALGSGIVVKSRTYNPPPQPIFFRAGKVTRVTEAKVSTVAQEDGPFGFAGVEDHYFVTLVVQPSVAAIRVNFANVEAPIEGTTDVAHYINWSARYPASADQQTFFAGPKDFDQLIAVDRDLVRSIDFGVFAWIVVPLLRALKWINLYVHNFGWSLIILTVLINLVIFPLRHKSVVSMRRMQEIQPEMKAIQDRYANLKMSDPGRAKMNSEMMALYKERGVNPASGCVPMLLTLPLIYAFYAMLSVAIELRGAPFVGWVHDLSAADPYYVWPVLMGITMFIQQKMTPTGAADPTQQKIMMWVMPIMMTFMFLWAAAGLTIYWTVSQLWGIGQQAITNRIIGPPAQRVIRPPAQRQLKNLKNAGGGKTDQAKERE